MKESNPVPIHARVDAPMTADRSVDVDADAPRSGAAMADVAAHPRDARRPFMVLAALAVVVAAVIGGYLAMTAGKESTDDAQLAADIVPVAARVSGQVARVLLKDNEQVKFGQPILEIDSTDYSAKVEQAEAQLEIAQAQAAAAQAQVAVVEATSRGGLASARAQVSGSTSAVSGARAQVAVARAALSRAQADQHKAELDLDRAQALRKTGAIAQANLETAEAAFDVAVAADEQAQAQVVVAEENAAAADGRVGEAQGRLGQSQPVTAQIATAHAALDLAKAQVKNARVALQLAQLQLSYTQVTAPGDGVASKLSVHPGQLVQVGQELVEFVPVGTYVIANFKETQIGEMRPGQRVEINVDAFGRRTLEGKVESLTGATGATFSMLPPDNATGNFVKVVQRVPVRIVFVAPPADLHLMPGLSADVTVHVR
jgi:membrane fusion protein, multidrug efflux system